MSGLTNEQAAELGHIGRKLTLILGNLADAFCEKHGIAENGQAFNATMLTLIETLVFVTLTSAMPDNPVQQRKTADELHGGIKKLLRDWAIERQLQTLRNHPKGTTQ